LTTAENNKQAKEKKEDAQKDDILQPITKVNTKLDKELQEWEVESMKVTQMTEADDKRK